MGLLRNSLVSAIHLLTPILPFCSEVIAVGPLPISNATHVEDLSWQMTSGSNKIRNWNADEDALGAFMYNFSASIQDIVKDLIKVKAVGDDDDNADIWGIDVSSCHPLLHYSAQN